MSRQVAPPAYPPRPERVPELEALRFEDREFAGWMRANVSAHRVPGYAIVTLSLKKGDVAPGDASAEQMDAIAELADKFGVGEIRVSHEQNLILPHIALADLPRLWPALKVLGLA